ncbi:hypothetical protein CURTO8I2_90006 [Curtobacterium sp. 8I-2]|nr:hypothetical protein CURTO8I2_90006 [Curtobacterium sp. 8I-2]
MTRGFPDMTGLFRACYAQVVAYAGDHGPQHLQSVRALRAPGRVAGQGPRAAGGGAPQRRAHRPPRRGAPDRRRPG